MILGHVMGLPIEESVLQLAPVGAVTLTAAALAGRAALERLTGWLHRKQEPGEAEI
jgi:hypothetical protein